MTSLACLRPTI